MIRKQISHLLGSSRDQPGLHVSSTEVGKRCTTMSAKRLSFKRLWTRMLAWYGRQWVALFPWFESLHAIIFSNITSLGWEGLSLEMEQTTNSVLFHRASVLLWHFDQIFLWSFQPRCIIIITQMDTEAHILWQHSCHKMCLWQQNVFVTTVEKSEELWFNSKGLTVTRIISATNLVNSSDNAVHLIGSKFQLIFM